MVFLTKGVVATGVVGGVGVGVFGGGGVGPVEAVVVPGVVVVPGLTVPGDPVLLIVPTAVLDDPEFAAATVVLLDAPLVEPQPLNDAVSRAMLAATRISDRNTIPPEKRPTAAK